MDDKRVIGTRVQVLREAQKPKKISQRRLAARIGVSHSTIYRLEGGEHLPGAPTLVKIAHALGTTFEALTGSSSTDQSAETPEEREYLEDAMEGNPDGVDRAAVLMGIRAVLARSNGAPKKRPVVAPASEPSSSRPPPAHKRRRLRGA